METLLIALSPFLTSLITGWVKGWTPFSMLSDTARVPVIRVLGALIAIVYTIASIWITGSIDPSVLNGAITTFILAMLAWLGSLGIFHAFFQSKPQ